MKTRRLQFLIVAAVVVCNLPSVWAAFGPLVTMGPTVVLSDPSCASPADGQAVCAARGLGQTLVVNKWSGSSWGGWKPVAGTVTSNPSCSSDGSGRVVCAARNDTGGISATVYNGTVWGALTKVGGQITFEPSCAPLTAGKVLCVARNTIGGFTSTVFNGTTWSLFKTLKGSIIGPPGCGSDGAGAVVCLATSTTSIFNVVAARFNGTAWSTVINIGGNSITDRYSCTPSGAPLGVVACAARGTNIGQYVNTYNGGAWAASSWSGWSGLGGTVGPGTSCAQTVAGQLGCAAVASDAAVWTNSFNGAGWTGWAKIGGIEIGNPSCASLGTTKVICAVVGLNGKAVSTVGP